MNMMNINNEPPNNVNGASSNGGVTFGRSLVRQARTGRYQTTGQEEREGQVPTVINATVQHQETNEETTENNRQRRQKWTKEDNKELWRCFIMSDSTTKGYRKRMKEIWEQRNNPPKSEQRLADQIRAIKTKKWLSSAETEELTNYLTPIDHSPAEEEERPDNDRIVEQISRFLANIRQSQERTAEPETTELSNDEEQDLEKIHQWMTPDQRIKLPSLKAYNHIKLKEKTIEVNRLLSHIPTNNITETNNLAYAGARLVTEKMGVKLSTQQQRNQPNQQPPWKRRLQKQLTEMRGDLSKLKEIKSRRLRKEKIREQMEKKYNIQEKGLNHIIETQGQRIKAVAYKIQRYENRNKGFQQNKLFETNQKRLYDQLKGSAIEQDKPDIEESKRLWENIWGHSVSHNSKAKWLDEIKEKESTRVPQQRLLINNDTVASQLRKLSNWKVPGLDEVHGNWLKNFKSLHQRLAHHLKYTVENQQTPTWMITGRTTLVQKDKSKGNAASNYRPITCLPMMWKLLTGIISDQLTNYLEETKTIPQEQKGCRRGFRGTKDQLLIDKLVMKNSRRRKTNLSMAWIDYKKAFDMIPHSWLIECLKIYGANEYIIKLLESTMPHWKTILTAGGEKLAEVNIKRGIFQGDSLSPLLFIIAMIPLSEVLKKMTTGYQVKKNGNKINHLMFMDDIKLFGKSIYEIDTLVQTVRIISQDIRMEFGIDKCALVNLIRGKVTRIEGIQLPDGSQIKEIDEAGYKYLGIIEGDMIKHKEMKD